MTSIVIYVEFVLYLGILIGIGVYGNRLTESSSDYLLGGRRLNTVSAALSEQASLWSGWLVVGFPAIIYTSGISGLWWMVWQIPLGLVTWGLLATRIGRYSRILKSLTVPDFLSARHSDSYHLIRVVSTVVIGVFMTGYIAGQLLAGGSAIVAAFDLPYSIGFLLTLIIVLTYTFLGGFLASTYTDVLQAVMMTAFAIIVPLAALLAVGGPTELMVGYNNAVPAEMTSFFGGRTAYGFLVFSTIAFISLGGLGQPHGVVRYMGAKQPSKAGFAMVIAVVFMLIAFIGVPIVALAGVVLVPELNNPDLIAPLVVLRTLPSWVAGLMLAGIVAAIMSTADSQLLVAGSAVGEDVYKDIFKPEASDRQILLFNRLAVAGIAVLAGIWAWITPGSVHTTILFAWAGLGAGIGPALLLSVYWEKATGPGTVAGMIVGLITVIVWQYLTGGPYMIFEIYPLMPGFIFALVAIIVGSVLTGPPERGEETIARELDEITKPLQEEISFVRDRQHASEPVSPVFERKKVIPVTNEEIAATYLSKNGLEDLPTAKQ